MITIKNNPLSAMMLFVLALAVTTGLGASTVRAQCGPDESHRIESGVFADLFGHSAALKGGLLAVGAAWHNDRVGKVFLYRFDGSEWREILQIDSPTPAQQKEFGEAVATTGDVVIAAGGELVYAYHYDGVGWHLQQQLQPLNPAGVTGFGGSVAADSDLALVSDHSFDKVPANNDDSGAAWVFRWDGSSWREEAQLINPDVSSTDDLFGTAVDIAGSLAVVGVPYDDELGQDAGSVHVYRFVSPAWVHEAKLYSPNPAPGHNFGNSVGVEAGVIVVGARHDDSPLVQNSGAAYVFRWNRGSWQLEDKLTSTDSEPGDGFGWSVSIGGDRIVVGAEKGDDLCPLPSGAPSTGNPVILPKWRRRDTGAAYVYRYTGTGWVQEHRLNPSDGTSNDLFGRVVSVDSGRILVTALKINDGINWYGRAFVYDLP